MVIVGLLCTFAGNSEMDAISGGTLAGTDGSRMPSENKLVSARFQGGQVAAIAAKLAALAEGAAIASAKYF